MPPIEEGKMSVVNRAFDNCTQTLILLQFSDYYHVCHGYLSLILCIIGISMNVFNVIILSQPNMRNSTNLLLSNLACSDGLVMVVYIIYDMVFRINSRLESGMTKAFAYALLVNVIAQNLFHTFSTWIIVVLAGYRLVYIHAGPQARTVCTSIRVWVAIFFVALISIILTIPLILAHEVTFHRKCLSLNSSFSNCQNMLYEVDYVDNNILRTILFYNSALMVKALPIMLMAVLSTMLIQKIREKHLTRRRLQMSETLRSSIAPSAFQIENDIIKSSERSKAQQNNCCGKTHLLFVISCFCNDNCRQNNAQTTHMLLAVILMYIITYLPQSVMLILNQYMGQCFREHVYERLGDFMDILTLANSGITFILYCVMSAQFRNTFMRLFVTCRRIGKSKVEAIFLSSHAHI